MPVVWTLYQFQIQRIRVHVKSITDGQTAGLTPDTGSFHKLDWYLTTTAQNVVSGIYPGSAPVFCDTGRVYDITAFYGDGDKWLNVSDVVRTTCEDVSKCLFPVREEMFRSHQASRKGKKLVVSYNCFLKKEAKKF
ncbi:hypothetical protein FSP39_003512 [Pinctada imbricata]|uniref:Uncharacterized protein n=1 Tax=Pinctada imbricata TaxID=66713 RepID=A0AA88XS19_PINIB|nr:hypothetical protein FSP39_003512 [Pinctada imbricata]